MAATKFIITHEMSVDIGNVPPQAMAEYLLAAENSDWNIWEIASHGDNGKLVGVEVAK